MTSRKSSGSSRADSAVEPTRSQNITVSCRRSASARCPPACGGDAAEAAAARWVPPSAAIAARSLRRWPTEVNPDPDQVLRRQLRQHFAIDLVVAESGLVFFQTQAAQPGCRCPKLPRFRRNGISLQLYRCGRKARKRMGSLIAYLLPIQTRTRRRISGWLHLDQSCVNFPVEDAFDAPRRGTHRRGWSPAAKSHDLVRFDRLVSRSSASAPLALTLRSQSSDRSSGELR